MRLTPAQVAAAAQETITRALAGIQNLVVQEVVFAGTTAYSHDGAGVQNRAHRLSVTLLSQQPGVFGILLPASVVLQVDLVASFEPIDRAVVGNIVRWAVLSGDVDQVLLAGRLDPLIFARFELLAIDDTEAGEPFAVLSAKTMPSGDVFVFIEPPDAA